MQSNKNLKTKNYLIIILLVIIILYGFLLRIFDLGLTSFWIDEATSAVSGMQILKFGLPIFESGVFYQASIIHSYLIAVSMLIFGISEFSARFPATIIGSFLILLSFILGKNIKDSKTGLIFAFFMSISYFEILWSRQARFYILLQAGYLICLILFLNYTKKELNLKSIGILLLFTLLTILSNLLGAVLIFIYTIYIIYLLKIKKFKISKTVILYINKHKKYLILVLVLLAVILSIYFNLLKIIGILVTESLKNISVGYYIDFITSHFSYTLILMIIGLIYLYTKSKETFVFILINLVLPVVIISLIIPTPYMRYVFTFTFPLIFLLISIGITYSIEKLITQLNNNLIKNKNLIQSITNLGILILIIFILIFSSNLTSLTPQIYSQKNWFFLHFFKRFYIQNV